MGDLIDTALGVGASLDWISPVAGWIQDLMNGPSHTFLISWSGCPMSGREVGRLLRKRGVKCWGLMIVSGTLMVSVKLAQASYAQHLLEQAGIPIENPIPAGQGQGTRGRRAPRKQQRPIQERSQILRRLEGRR